MLSRKQTVRKITEPALKQRIEEKARLQGLIGMNENINKITLTNNSRELRLLIAEEAIKFYIERD